MPKIKKKKDIIQRLNIHDTGNKVGGNITNDLELCKKYSKDIISQFENICHDLSYETTLEDDVLTIHKAEGITAEEVIKNLRDTIDIPSNLIKLMIHSYLFNDDIIIRLKRK